MAHVDAHGAGGAPPREITCREAVAALYEFLDGELGPVSHEEVKAHFDVCQRCYPHLRLEEAFRAALQRACAGAAAPETLRDRLKAMLSEADPG